jgi:hypothetical protein
MRRISACTHGRFRNGVGLYIGVSADISSLSGKFECLNAHSHDAQQGGKLEDIIVSLCILKITMILVARAQ